MAVSVWPPKCKHLFFLIQTLIMVWTKIQLENMSKYEPIYKVLSLENFKNDINSKLLDLNDCFINFDAKYKMVNSNLSISRRCNEFLLDWFTQFERNSVNNTLCNRRETIELIQCYLISSIIRWSNQCGNHLQEYQ